MGEITPRFGKPGHDRHKPYTGMWCQHAPVRCDVCFGGGVERDKPNPMAGMRIHFNADGYIVGRERIE